MGLLLSLTLSLGVGLVPPAPAQPCTSNIAVTQVVVDNVAFQDPPQLVGDSIQIKARVVSTCQVQTVVAEAFSHSLPLVYDPPTDYWVGTFSLASDPHTAFALTVTATDVNATTAFGIRSLIHDTKPVITITAPGYSAVARPSLQVTASCADDDPGGCTLIRVTAPFAAGNPTLASGTTGINQTVSLAAYEGQRLLLRFEAVDSRSQAATSTERFVFIESNPHLVEDANAAGTILDDSADRTLFLAEDLHPNVREKAGGATVQLSTSIEMPTNGRLTDHGALSLANPTAPLDTWSVFELRDGVVTNLADTKELQVKSPFALVGPQLLGDLDAGTWTTVPIPNTAGNNQNGVGPNGDYVYWTAGCPPCEIYRYRSGIATQLTSAGVRSVYPQTDGVNVAYQQINGSGNTLAIRLVTDGGDVLLADYTGYTYAAKPQQDYATNGGWTAFVKPLNGAFNVWRRSPGGTISQVSFFGTNATIDALNSDGAVTIRNASRLWLAPPTGALQQVSQSQFVGTRSFWRDGDLYVIIGASVFKLVPAPTITAHPANQTATFGQTATFNVTVSGTGPFTYQWYTGVSGDTSNPIVGATSNSYTTPPLSGPLSNPTRYWVRVSSLTESVNSNDALLTIAFTDNPLVAGVTMIKAVHINELRARIEAVRAKYALTPFSYSEPSIVAGTTIVGALSILELRTALAQAYTAAGQTPPSYSTTPAAGVTVLAADIASLRSAVVALE